MKQNIQLTFFPEHREERFLSFIVETVPNSLLPSDYFVLIVQLAKP